MKKTLLLFCAAILTATLSSCYNRLTGNYDEFPDLHESKSAIVDEVGLSKEEQERRREILKAMNSEPPTTYKINAGDSVAIVVYNHPDLAMRTVVTPDGYIGMVFVGQVKVADKTLPEAAKAIEDALSSYIKNPAVGISPGEVRSSTATIVGAVGHPGVYQISQGMRLAELYATAGGSSTRLFDGQVLDAADLVNSMFIREGKIIDAIDFRKAIELGDIDNNVLLHKGDYIYIAVRSESMVCLIGDVGHSYKRLWDNNLGLLELLTTGGFVRETYWPYVIIIRGGVANPTIYKVDLDAILQGRRPNVMLESGDIVYLPHDNISEFNVFVRKLLPTGSLINLIHGTTHTTW